MNPDNTDPAATVWRTRSREGMLRRRVVRVYLCLLGCVAVAMTIYWLTEPMLHGGARPGGWAQLGLIGAIYAVLVIPVAIDLARRRK